MKPDTAVARYLAAHTGEHGALPLPVLLVLLVCIFGLGALTVWKLGNLKTYLGEPPFPTHAASVLAAIIVFLGLGVVAICRAALGMEWPSNYEIIVGLVGGALGVVGIWGGVKRATSAEAYEGKAKVEAAKTGAAVPSDMKATQEHRAPSVSRVGDDVAVPPKAGVAADDPAHRHTLETAARGNAPLEASD